MSKKYIAIHDSWITDSLFVKQGKEFQPMNKDEIAGVEFCLQLGSIKEIESKEPIVEEVQKEVIEEAQEPIVEYKISLTHINGIGEKTYIKLVELGIDTEEKLKEAILNDNPEVIELVSKKLELIKEYLSI